MPSVPSTRPRGTESSSMRGGRPGLHMASGGHLVPIDRAIALRIWIQGNPSCSCSGYRREIKLWLVKEAHRRRLDGRSKRGAVAEVVREAIERAKSLAGKP